MDRIEERTNSRSRFPLPDLHVPLPVLNPAQLYELLHRYPRQGFFMITNSFSVRRMP